MAKRRYHSPPSLEELEGIYTAYNSPNNLDYKPLSESFIEYILTYN